MEGWRLDAGDSMHGHTMAHKSESLVPALANDGRVTFLLWASVSTSVKERTELENRKSGAARTQGLKSAVTHLNAGLNWDWLVFLSVPQCPHLQE